MKKGLNIKFGIALLVSLAMVVLMGCTQNEFGEQEFSKFSFQVNVGQVDILFVVDTSGSMSEEQRKMAQAFDNFLQGLNIPGVDYRIGIITMDVESKTNPPRDFGNGLRAEQNGNLLQFPDGSYYLTPDSNNIEDQFWQTIRREETLDCERNGFDTSVCPSDDERGIYSAFLTVNANKKNFFRENGHVAFVFLTDEDVRGNGLSRFQAPNYMPESLDYPVNLIQAVKSNIGNNTTISAHAIITDGVTCLNQQNAQNGNSFIDGKIGTFYSALTNPNNFSLADPNRRLGDYAGGNLVQGVVGSICASNYSTEVGNIASVITQTKSEEKFRCILDREESLDVRISDEYSWTLNENRDGVIFTPALPAGQSFVIKYECYQ
jgi:hypothetical protein